MNEELGKKAIKRSEAIVYSLNNLYLNSTEKREVEMWYQLPGNVLLYTLLITAVWSVVWGSFEWSRVILIPLMVNVIVGLLNWYYYNKNLVYKLYLTIFHSWVVYAVCFGVAIFFFHKGIFVLAVISLVAPFGLLSLIEPSIILYALLAQKYKMNPKYAFFKKEYGRTFPFEQ